MLNNNDLKQALAHVLWIGGATDAGKSSVAERLVQKYKLRLYSFDEQAENFWENHLSKMPLTRSYAWMAMAMDERWVSRSPETMAEEGLQITQENFPFALEELLALPKEPLIVAEGFEFLPELVEPLISTPRQAIWFMPTETFRRDSFDRRGKTAFHANRSDPERAAYNHFNRDRLFAQHVKEQALGRNLKLLEIDGSLSLDEVTSVVERHFEPFLTAYS
jgi:hypothetical protein